MPTPSQAIIAPQSTADISHALSTSLRDPERVLAPAADTAASPASTRDFSEPPTVRGQNW